MNNKRKPTKLKILQGRAGHHPLPENEPEPDVNIPAPPVHLSKIALEEWNRITPELEILGLISNIDRTALAAYCQCYGRWVQAEKQILKDAEEHQNTGFTDTTTNGNVIQSPLVGIANMALQLMHKYLTEFGMTPSSRSRVTASKKEKDKKAGWGSI